MTKRPVALLRVLGLLVVLGGLALVMVPGSAHYAFAEDLSLQHLAVGEADYAVMFPSVLKLTAESPGVFGLQYYSTLEPDAGPALHVQAGARWARFYVGWSGVEPKNTTPEYYNWSGMDTHITNAKQTDLELVLNVNVPPDWSVDFGDPDDLYDGTKRLHPDYYSEFAEFIGALVERYDGDGIDDAVGSPVVTYIEIFNEPDRVTWRSDHSHYGSVPEDYAEVLSVIYPAAKAASPDVQIVMGGLALDWFVSDGGAYYEFFLDEVLEACAGKDCFDYINYHYYPLHAADWAAYGPGLVGKTVYIRQVMQEYGYSQYPIMCTEVGWGSADTWGGDRAQQRYVVKSLVRGKAANLTNVIFFKSDDIASNGDESRLPGLLTTEYAPKAAYYTMEAALPLLNHADYVRAIPSSELGNSNLEGYEFASMGKRIDVVWVVDHDMEDSSNEGVYSMRVSGSAITVHDMYGQSYVMTDAGDGLDGRITLLVGGDPLIIVYN